MNEDMISDPPISFAGNWTGRGMGMELMLNVYLSIQQTGEVVTGRISLANENVDPPASVGFGEFSGTLTAEAPMTFAGKGNGEFSGFNMPCSIYLSYSFYNNVKTLSGVINTGGPNMSQEYVIEQAVWQSPPPSAMDYIVD